MRGKVALVREQGQDFAVLLVKDPVLGSVGGRQNMLAFGQREFGRRTALMGQRGGTWGPPDIVNWLSGIDPGRLPWREFSINN